MQAKKRETDLLYAKNKDFIFYQVEYRLKENRISLEREFEDRVSNFFSKSSFFQVHQKWWLDKTFL